MKWQLPASYFYLYCFHILGTVTRKILSTKTYQWLELNQSPLALEVPTMPQPLCVPLTGYCLELDSQQPRFYKFTPLKVLAVRLVSTLSLANSLYLSNKLFICVILENSSMEKVTTRYKQNLSRAVPKLFLHLDFCST